MKLYYHPISTTCRPIMLFAAEAGIALDYEFVDLFTGAHYKPEYEAINPSKQVPVLEDGDLVLTESSAILKYVADKVGSPAYPKDLKARARVNEVMVASSPPPAIAAISASMRSFTRARFCRSFG